MQKISNYIILFILLLSNKVTSQTYTMIDFGSNLHTTTSSWNNVIVNAPNQIGNSINLIDFDGEYTGETLQIDDSFDLINDSGTTTPDSSLPFTDDATRDNFFGEINPFSGNTNPTGGFILSNLDPTKYYSFSIFSSRMGVTDNREALYTITGQNTLFDSLNPSNNTANTATILNIQPTAGGTITFNATAGPNNDNSFGFYYLGAIKMVSSTTPISNINDQYLSLIYPKENNILESGKTVSIEWQSYGLNDVTLEYSTNNGNSWNSIATTPSSAKKYEWTIPSTISDECIVRINSNGLTEINDGNFSIIANDGLTYKIVILGSSTSAGTGPNDINNAWVWRYDYFLNQTDTRFEIENLGVGGFTTYNILPTGSTIPNGVIHEVDVEHNITKALTLNPDGIIINLPSNDATFHYSTAVQIENYHIIRDLALANNIPVWISSPQPKNFGADTVGLNIQLEILEQTPIEFGEFAFDFWTGFGNLDNNGLKPEFNVDGTHMNDAGHRILFDRVINKGIHTIIKNNVDQGLNTISNSLETEFINIYPNPFKNIITFKLGNNIDTISKITIFDVKGKVVFSTNASNNVITISPFSKVKPKGVYFCKIITNKNTINKKIIFN